ncbi:MAG: MFS transporter, partial [Chloroflexota bacterium]|nr:MFS transporter [Chloroflexota bacterium]
SAMAIGLSNSYFMVVVLLMIMGLVSGIQHPTAVALLSEYFPKNRARAFGLNMIGGSASFFITYPLAGLIANAAGWRWAYLLMPIPALLTGLVFWRIMKGREPEEVTQSLSSGQGRRTGPSIPVWQGLRLIAIVLIISVLSRMLTSGTVPLLSLYLVDKHGVAPALAGVMIGAIYGAGVVGAPLSGILSDRLGRKAVFLVCVAAIGPLILLITMAPSPLALLPIFILLGMAMQGREPPLQSLVAEAVPQEQRATMMGVYFFLSMEMGGLSSPLTGYLMEQLGPDRALTYLALGAIALSAVIWLVRKKV